MRKNWLLLSFVLLLAVLAIGAAACGGDDGEPTVTEEDAGDVLVDDSNTVIVFPPYSLDGDPVAGEGVGTLATITRDDGTTQVTHNGRPLYYYAEDTGVGDQAGDGINDVWHIVPGAE